MAKHPLQVVWKLNVEVVALNIEVMGVGAQYLQKTHLHHVECILKKLASLLQLVVRTTES
jgi:hypothetical protein